MDPGDQLLSIEEFSSWRTENLKKYLTVRGLTQHGTKEELVALCFSACRLGLPVKPTQSEVLLDNEKVYANILSRLDIQDPLKMYDGWLEEKAGISKWPPTFLSDITSFLLEHGDTPSVAKVLKDYKVGKAYEYFACGWLQEVFYHPITNKSVQCILRAKCCPSQRLKSESHDVWVCVQKTDGAILGAYCSCTAGLGQTCNHVASLLFRVESANRFGMGSCTSSTCGWVAPKTVKTLKPCQLSDMTIQKSNRSKSVKSRLLVAKNKKDFLPVHEEIDGKKTMSSIAVAMRGILPNACILTALPKNDDQPEVPPANTDQQEAAAEVPTFTTTDFTLDQIAHNYKSQTSCYDFLNYVPKYSSNEITFIEKSTTGQHENENWFQLRKGRITASKFYQVFTRVNTVLKCDTNNVVDCSSLIKLIMGYKKINPNIKALKYGRETEPVAVDNYLSSYKKCHQNVVFRKCGMFIDSDNSFLAATPDLLVSCSCCGDGLLEVKCPIVPECSTCSGFCSCNFPEYIVYHNNTFSIKQNHAYYTQVQGQLAITGRKWCDLFIFTVNGNLEQRMVLDKKAYLNGLFPNLKYFFKNFIVPEILHPKLNTHEELPEPMEVDTFAIQTYFCPKCQYVIKEAENVVSYNERSVGCDNCNLWFHFKCVNFKVNDSKKSKWLCPDCK